eukprot:3913011-Pyramimonas_sp.AAC.1
MGPLCGTRQVVARGDNRAFLLALESTTGYMLHITGFEPLAAGWYTRMFERPHGPDADLWARIRDQLCARP